MEQNLLFQKDINEIEKFDLPWSGLSGMQIFCTGATGFIGRWLTAALHELDARKRLNMGLWLLRRTETPECLNASNIHWIEGDITSNFLPEDFAPDIIIHAASPASIQAYLKDPVGLPEANIIATHYLLERARACGSIFIFFSSATVYSNQTEHISETAQTVSMANMPTVSMYAASKLAGELLCEKYRQRYNVDCRIIRPFSIHGPGESLNSGRFFTDFLRQALVGRELVVTGTGMPVRDSCYLSDFVSGLLYVLLKGESTAYNIGNEDNVYTILELAKQIAELCGIRKVVGPLCETSHTAGDFLVPDTTKLRRLGWRPQVDLQTCIRRCLDSYQAEGEKI